MNRIDSLNQFSISPISPRCETPSDQSDKNKNTIKDLEAQLTALRDEGTELRNQLTALENARKNEPKSNPSLWEWFLRLWV